MSEIKKKAALVTVIMPAYNAEGYIEKSIRSVLGQSLSDLELLVVNDGSKDGTAALVEAISAEDGRVRLMSIENCGPAMARNRALEQVNPDTGYIAFIDSDDELLPDALEYALSAAEKGADIAVNGFSIIGADGSRRDYCEKEEFFELEALGNEFARLYRANLLNQVWGKLYRASLILENNIRFKDYRWGEDRLFVFDCLEKARSIAVLPECKYRYIMHEGESLITKFYDKKAEVCLLIDSRVQQLCRRFGTEDESWFRYMFAKSIFSCFTNLFSPSCKLSRKEKLEYIKGIIGLEQVKSRCRDAAGGLPVKLLCAVVQSGLPGLNLLVFSMVAWAGKTLPGLFMALKHRK